jgi:hypothetical protein
MKFLIIFFSLFIVGCATSIKLTGVQLLPISEYSKKPVSIQAEVRGANQLSCSKNGELYQLQNGHWVKIKNELDPSDSATPYFLDGQFSPRTMWGEGCDVEECVMAQSSINFDLAEYKNVGEKPNPNFKGKTVDESGWPIPITVPDYKTKLLSGHFKVIYIYYTDADCMNRSEKEIEFDIP